MSHIDKVIISSDSGLAKKYGAAGKSVIDAAVARLIAADAVRGLTAQYISVTATSERDYKNAVDAIYLAHTPDYIAILGAPDVFPHQRLTNPLSSPDDLDADIPSDLPYACAATYSVNAADFIAPDRVVSRIPDLLGATDPAYLEAVLDIAASASTPPAGSYSSFLGISAGIWKKSTNLSLKHAFGSATGMQVSPSDGAAWSPAQWSSLSHFINCHGATADWRFLGEDEFEATFDAHLADLVATSAQPGTIVAAECCFGAELYDPAAFGIHQGIANTYLERGAFGFFGSTNIAYGECDKTVYADLLCAYFFRHVLAGSSLGAATLAARQDYVRLNSPLDPVSLKTLAQFLLLGDPSIHAVASLGLAEAALPSNQRRAHRRRKATAEALTLESTTIASDGVGRESSSEVQRKHPDFVKNHERSMVLTFDARPRRGGVNESLMTANVEPTSFHVALTSRAPKAGAVAGVPHGITRAMVRVATEVGGILTNVKTGYAR